MIDHNYYYIYTYKYRPVSNTTVGYLIDNIADKETRDLFFILYPDARPQRVGDHSGWLSTLPRQQDVGLLFLEREAWAPLDPLDQP